MGSDRREREAAILDQLAKDGRIQVSTIANDLGVSEVTVRATLRELESQGLLRRTHGGAVPSSIHHVLARRNQQADAKERIAKAAAALVRDGDHLMIEAGTTTALVPRFLTGKRDIHIVTNSTLVVNYARVNPELHVTLTGGAFHRESESMVGAVARASIARFNARLAFVGTDGLRADRGLTTQFAEGADIITAMHANASATWLLTDATKYGRAGFVNVLAVDELAGIITDTELDPDAAQLLQDHGVSLRAV
ncbi:MAG: DeoR/GlpR family DNA-binding transcription regulator [Bowdeniella nasicola]|nr:DeoR/GlpR family DNA-binding transcription regulator [Bowdeniella nasicola]